MNYPRLVFVLSLVVFWLAANLGASVGQKLQSLKKEEEREGFGVVQATILLFLVLPLAVSITFFLIADIDSPRRGLIRIHPDNLIGLSQSLGAR